MKIKNFLLFLFSAAILFTGCSKDQLEENQKMIKKSWKLDAYLHNNVDRTSSLIITGYDESYTDNAKYDRSYTDANNNKQIQTGTFEFENATRLKISGVGSIEFINGETATSSYYDIVKLTDSQLWYSYTNGGDKHEFRLSRK